MEQDLYCWDQLGLSVCKIPQELLDKFQGNGQETIVECAFTAKQILEPTQFKLAVTAIWTHNRSQYLLPGTHLFSVFIVCGGETDSGKAGGSIGLNVSPFGQNILKTTNGQS